MPWEKETLRLGNPVQANRREQDRKIILFKLQSNKNNLQIINYC